MGRRKQRLERVAWAKRMESELARAKDDARVAKAIAVEAQGAAMSIAAAKDMLVVAEEGRHVVRLTPFPRNDTVVIGGPVHRSAIWPVTGVDYTDFWTTSVRLVEMRHRMPCGVVLTWVAPDLEGHR